MLKWETFTRRLKKTGENTNKVKRRVLLIAARVKLTPHPLET